MARTPKVTKEELLSALKRHNGDYLKTALELGISLTTVYRSVDRYGIEVTTKRRIRAA